MLRRDPFSEYHPGVCLAYFVSTIAFSMVLLHPVCLLISLFSSFCWLLLIRGRHALQLTLTFCLPVMLLTALINPLFSHQGSTVLLLFPNGNPLTLESIFYGLAAAVMLAAVIYRFGCYHFVMTSDKYVHLFGRILPALSLLFSMTLRFIPAFRQRFAETKEASAQLLDPSASRVPFSRLRFHFSCFRNVMTRTLENGVDTARSMRGRGYGLPGRSAFTLFQMTAKDWLALLAIGLLSAVVFSAAVSGQLLWRYYPALQGMLFDPLTVFSETAYLLLSAFPLILMGKEAVKWHFSH